MKIAEFLDKLRQLLEKESDRDALPFFNCLFRENLIRTISVIPDVPTDWQETDIVSPDHWKSIYKIAIDILWDAACRNSSESLPETFQEATVISFGFCTTLEEELAIEILPITIESPTRMMKRQGLLEVKKGKDGRDYVRLSKKGKRVAEEFEAEIKHGGD